MKKTNEFAQYTFVFATRERGGSEGCTEHQQAIMLPADIDHDDNASGHDARRDNDQHSFRLMEDRGFEAKVQGADPQTDLAVTSIDGEVIDSWQDTWVTKKQKKSWT